MRNLRPLTISLPGVIRLLLIVPALIAALVVFGGKGAVLHASTAQATGSLTVGLDMQTCGAVATGCTSIDPGVYGTALPKFESCVDVNTSVNSFFYIDVFALNASQLVAFSADVAFTADKMQIQQADVKKLLGSTASNVTLNADSSTGVLNPTTSSGLLEAAAYDSSTHSGSGVLVRLQAQAFIPPAGGIVIPFTITTDPPTSGYPGVTLTADNGGTITHPGDTNGDGVYDGPFINATTGQIAVNRPDGDGDGVSDTCDNCPTTPNGPAQASVLHVGNQLDTDGDGIGDACDPDADGDGILNGADDCPYVYDNPQNPSVCLDTDGDGFIDSLDNCPTVSNTDQLDADGDGVGNACDPDFDNDGICNTGGPLPNGTLGTPAGGCAKGASGADNCPLAANPTQADWNHDGTGDACQDSDGDNVLDSVDNCPADPNISQTDTDGDGVGDACDNCPNWPNVSQALPAWPVPADDSDCDGFPSTIAAGLPNPRSSEAHMSTDATRHCAADIIRNNEAPDSWPPDFDDNQRVNGSDFLTFAPYYGKILGDPGYDARWDLNNDDKVNGTDFLKMAPFYGKLCV